MGFPSTLAGQISFVVRKIEELERRLHNTNRKGTIVQTDYEKGEYRVELLADNGKGEPYLTPWIKIKESAAGANKTHFPKSIGEQVSVRSENGDLTEAEISHSLSSDENKPPSNKGDEYILSQVGKTKIHITDGGDAVVLQVGSSSIKLTDGEIILTTPKFTGVDS